MTPTGTDRIVSTGSNRAAKGMARLGPFHAVVTPLTLRATSRWSQIPRLSTFFIAHRKRGRREGAGQLTDSTTPEWLDADADEKPAQYPYAVYEGTAAHLPIEDHARRNSAADLAANPGSGYDPALLPARCPSGRVRLVRQPPSQFREGRQVLGRPGIRRPDRRKQCPTRPGAEGERRFTDLRLRLRRQLASRDRSGADDPGERADESAHLPR